MRFLPCFVIVLLGLSVIARAEIMDYLSQVYGSAFVEDLIKHLPQLRAEALTLAQLRCRITALATVS